MVGSVVVGGLFQAFDGRRGEVGFWAFMVVGLWFTGGLVFVLSIVLLGAFGFGWILGLP